MDKTALLSFAGVIGTLCGVLLGFGLNRWVATRDRRREVRSVSEALLWELKDCIHTLGVGVAILEAPIPSVDTLLERGLLMQLPLDAQEGVLKARSLIGLHNRTLARHIARPASSERDREENLKTLTEQAQLVLPYVEQAIQRIEQYRRRTDYGLLRRTLLRWRGKPWSRVTPRT